VLNDPATGQNATRTGGTHRRVLVPSLRRRRRGEVRDRMAIALPARDGRRRRSRPTTCAGVFGFTSNASAQAWGLTGDRADGGPVPKSGRVTRGGDIDRAKGRSAPRRGEPRDTGRGAVAFARSRRSGQHPRRRAVCRRPSDAQPKGGKWDAPETTSVVGRFGRLVADSQGSEEAEFRVTADWRAMPRTRTRTPRSPRPTVRIVRRQVSYDT
jgi:hypothetical protein